MISHMNPPSLTPPVKPKPAKPVPPSPAQTAQTGAAASPTAVPTVLEPNGAYTFLYTIDPQETKRLLTRTGRATREEMERELPRYVERIVKRAIDSEVY